MINKRTVNKYVFIWIVAIFPGLVFGIGFSTDSLKEAQVYLENGSFSKAYKLLTEELNQNPNNENALVMRGEALIGLRKHQEAIEDFSKALSLNPNSRKAQLGRSVSRFFLFQEAESIIDLKTLVEKDPKDFKAWIWLAKCNIDLGHLDDALKQIDVALNIENGYQDPYMLKAIIQIRKKNYIEAIENSSISIELTKKMDNYYNPYRERGVALVLLEHPELAIQDLLKALDKDKTDAGIFDYLANAYCQKGHYPKAIDAISKAIKLESKSTYFLYKRAIIYEYAGDYSNSIIDLGRLVDLTNDPEYFVKKGDLEVRAGLPENAISDYSKAIQIKPDSPFPFLARGSVHEEAGELDKALEDYSNASKINPNDYNCHLKIGTIYLKRKNYELAISSFSKCIKLDPKKMDAFLYRSTVFSLLGDKKNATADLAEIKKLKELR